MTVSALLLLDTSRRWWLAFIISALLLTLLWRRLFIHLPRIRQLRLGSLVLCSVLVAALFSWYFDDLTFDGRYYHTDAILGLLRGVNPDYQSIPALHAVYANHYPKAAEYYAAFVIQAFHSFQLGKIFHLLLIFAVAAYALGFLSQRNRLNRYSTLLALCVALSPVALAQITTYYVDGALDSLLTLVILASVNVMFRSSYLHRLILVISGSLAIGVKFTAVPYLLIIFSIVIIARIFTRNTIPGDRLGRLLSADMLTMSAVFLAGFLVLGFNPYVTNVLQHLNPLYPVLGPNKLPVMEGSVPQVFLDRPYGRVEKLVISFLSGTEAKATAPSALKVPFTFRLRELYGLIIPDARLGGWGIFFSGITLTSLGLLICLRGWRKEFAVGLVLLMVICSSLVNPECWWARFTPQIGLLPAFLLVPTIDSQSSRGRLVARCLCVLLLINNLMFVAGAMGYSFVLMRRLGGEFTRIARSGGAGEYWAYKPAGRDQVLHFEQFSGEEGIVICGQLAAPTSLPQGGFPVTIRKMTRPDELPDLVLYKSACSSGPPF